MDLKKIFSNKLSIIFFFLLIIVAGIILSVKWHHKNNEQTIIKLPFENCYAQNKICTLIIDELKIEISFSKNIYYLKHFDVSVSTESKTDIDVESIHIDFKMKNMNMGVNRFILTKISSENKRQNWKGRALLPVCVTGRADWVSELEIMTKQNKYILTLPLNVKQTSN